MSKLILFELNEVPHRIINYYTEMRPNSWIARNIERFSKFESFNENKGHLSPWNTWPTLHRGVTNEQHYISDFNQNLTEVDNEFPTLWQQLAKGKRSVGVFGSLHSYPVPKNLEHYKFYIPDVFSPSSECFPSEIDLFQDINLKLSRKSARNVESAIPFKDAFKLGMKSFSLGFRFSTMASIGAHLVGERLNRWKVVRRRTYQSVLSFDVFYKLLAKSKPDFVTFFTNHVASSQHRYWAALFPKDYEKMKFDQEWINTYNNEILFTMDWTDKMLERLGTFVDKNPDYKLVITSSMGQNAVESEPIETQLYVKDHEKFMTLFGLSKEDFQVKPAMLPQFNYEINSDKAADFEKKLGTLKINNYPVSYRNLGNNRFSLDFGHQNLKSVIVELEGKNIPVDDSGLHNVEIEDRSSATAYHIPEGHFFVYHPSFRKSANHTTALPTCEIAPSILANFSLAVPGYMKKASVVF